MTCWHTVFQQLNQVNLKLQGRGRTIVDFNDTLSAFRGETWQLEAESSNRKFCYVRESFHSGWWWSECWYSIGSCATAWMGLWGIFVVLSGNHQNKLGFMKNLCSSSWECYRLHARWTRILKPSSKLIRFVIIGWRWHLKALVFLYGFEESVDCHLLSSFCDDSNLHISLFKYVLSTMGVSKGSISKFLIGNRFSRWQKRKKWF